MNLVRQGRIVSKCPQVIDCRSRGIKVDFQFEKPGLKDCAPVPEGRSGRLLGGYRTEDRVVLFHLRCRFAG